MKRIYSIVVLLLLTCMTGIQAQRSWTLDTENATEIIAGEGNDYVLKEGFNTGGWSAGGYLNSGDGDCIGQHDVSCIYNFIEVDKKVVDGVSYPVYVLKNVGNSKYLSNGAERYVRSKNEAFKFTARKAVEFEDAQNKTDWIDYSHACSSKASHGCEEAGAWVLCSITQKQYIGFGNNPSWWSYVDTNNWLILKATEDKISAYEKMMIIFEKYFQNGVSEELYPVGTTPGCISQNLFDQMHKAYEDALAASAFQQSEISEAECDRIREAMVAAMERYNKELIPLGHGYYMMINGRSQDLAFDNGEKVKFTMHTEYPAKGWSLTNTLYIWEIVESAEEGKVFIKNWGSGRYIGQSPKTSSPHPMVADSTVKFTAPHYSGNWFLLHDGKNFAHNDGGGTLVAWNDKAKGANHFRFVPVPADTIDSLSTLVAQKLMNNKLAALVTKINGDVAAVKSENGFTDDDSYASAGLVSELTGINCQEPTAGPAKDMFDGKLNTFFHSIWTKAPEQDDWHWIQVDLGHAVSELYLKMSERQRNTKNSPSKMIILGAVGDDAAAEYTDELAVLDTIVYDRGDSTTYVGKISLARAAQFIRLAVTRTHSNALNHGRPFWSLSELRFYDVAESVENPLYAMVPQNVKDTLNAVIEKAKKELADKKATEATYKELEDAAEKFWDAYPDPSRLQDDVDYAQSLYDAALEGEELGFYKDGAKAELLAVIESVKAKMEKTLTLAEIETCEKQLKDAVALFNSKLNVPAAGIYRIISAAPVFTDEAMTKYRAQHQAAICSANADSTATPVWRYGQITEGDEAGNTVDKTARFNTLWEVAKDEKGYTFRNLANGFYMDNKYEGLTEDEIEKLDFDAVGYSKTPKHFTLEAAAEAGQFVIVMSKGQYVNLQPTGNVVHWSGRNDAHAPFTFELLDETSIEDAANWQVEAKPGKTQIITLPMAVRSVMTNNLGAMKVLGVLDGNIWFEEYVDEIIPAGVPFVVQTDAADEEAGLLAENFVTAELAIDEYTVEAISNLKYVYDPVKVNGLISAPKKVELDPGFGFIYNGKVIVAEGGEDIAAGSGYFNKEIPEATAEGTHSIVLEGTISGEELAVENIEVVKNVANDVYTISGVKIRSNVKSGESLQKLPKGIYIVGGKKFIVK